jgi:lipoprotein LprG
MVRSSDFASTLLCSPNETAHLAFYAILKHSAFCILHSAFCILLFHFSFNLEFPVRLRMLLLVLIVSVLTACGRPQADIPPPTPTPTPREIAAQAGAATQASQSVHFVMTLSGKPVSADTSGFTILNSLEGDLQRPDSALAVLSITIGGAVTEIRTVAIGDKQFATNPLTRQWQCLAPGAAFNPAVLFASEQGIEFLLQNAYEDVSLVGTVELVGRPHHHLRGTIPGAQLQPISLNLLGAGPVATELFADQETLRISRLVLVDTSTDPTMPSTWTIDFSDYDKAVDVREPVQC